ncbi:hypothetical protein Hypma_014411 [Hypsizygus marmoreus]|uniref:Uncharacterized protein n=1 Tax=Hypsizygus marmoreus TaxID=39966 RepID=A0A369JES7_HYPMA|nr:hypothetical protein Hypma_014411 [Hypsizygus marmoreus]
MEGLELVRWSRDDLEVFTFNGTQVFSMLDPCGGFTPPFFNATLFALVTLEALSSPRSIPTTFSSTLPPVFRSRGLVLFYHPTDFGMSHSRARSRLVFDALERAVNNVSRSRTLIYYITPPIST